jgi:hypothetical protein
VVVCDGVVWCGCGYAFAQDTCEALAVCAMQGAQDFAIMHGTYNKRCAIVEWLNS